jgi:hypothetical protein
MFPFRKRRTVQNAPPATQSATPPELEAGNTGPSSGEQGEERIHVKVPAEELMQLVEEVEALEKDRSEKGAKLAAAEMELARLREQLATARAASEVAAAAVPPPDAPPATPAGPATEPVTPTALDSLRAAIQGKAE